MLSCTKFNDVLNPCYVDVSTYVEFSFHSYEERLHIWVLPEICHIILPQK